MKSTLLSLAGLLTLAYVGLCIYLYLFQRSLIYFPTPKVTSAPAEDLWLESGGESLRIWRLHAGLPDAIIYFGGNAEDVSLNIPEFSDWFPGHTVYLVNYRGYGGSSGSPTEAGLYGDAETIFDFAGSRHETVSVIGRSLGSGVATHLAAARNIESLILITPFDSFAKMAKEHYPLFPISFLLKDSYDSESRAGKIDAPVLLLVAEYDEIVPLENSQRLAAAIDPSLLTLRVIENTSHNSIGTSPEYGRSSQNFMQAAAAERARPASQR